MMPRERYHTQPIQPPVPAAPPREGRMSVFARTDRGTRQRNQDAFLVADLTGERMGLGPEMTTHAVGERGSLLAVSDGMGDHGDLAAELVLATFHRVIGVIPPEICPQERLQRALRHTARHVWDVLQSRPELNGPSATITAILVCDHDAWVLQIGDSRAYVVRADRIEQVTKDQTLAEALLDSGAMQPESRPPDLLLQTIGLVPTIQPVVTRVDLHEGDRLLVCSDGLSNALGADDLLRIAGAASDPADACRQLVDAARATSGDNITVVLARIDEVAHDLDPDETVTWTLPAVLGVAGNA